MSTTFWAVVDDDRCPTMDALCHKRQNRPVSPPLKYSFLIIMLVKASGTYHDGNCFELIRSPSRRYCYYQVPEWTYMLERRQTAAA